MNWVTVVFCLTVLGLLTFGMVMLCSTSSVYAQDRFGNPYALFQKQLLWLGLGLAAAAITVNLDYHTYRKHAWTVFGMATALLLLVLVFGPSRNGARRWLVLGPVSFQPSEFAKFALVIVLACWLERMHRRSKGQLVARIKHPWWGFGIPLLLTAGLALLIIKEPDLGTVLLLFAVAVVLMWMAGSHAGWLGAFVGSGISGAALLLYVILHFGFLNDRYQIKRIIAWWTGVDPLDLNLQQQQAALAFGSGGLFGVGLGDSRFKQFYLPEAHTDFILPIIGEELGLVGSLSVLVAFFIIVICGSLLVAKSADLFGLLLGSGILAIISFQVLINVAVVTNAIPNKGMPLPLISYGGSNLVMALAMLGVLVNIGRQAHVQELDEAPIGRQFKSASFDSDRQIMNEQRAAFGGHHTQPRLNPNVKK